MKKKWITAALALSLCVSTQGITYAASTTKTVTGTQEVSYAKKGENKNIVTGKLENKNQSWTYNKKTHTLTIKGTGKLDVLYFKIPEGSDLDEGEAEIETPWFDYTDDITSVVIEDGITSVSATRFDELPNLQNITLGKGIKEITSHIFSKTNVTEVIIPDTVTSITKNAFLDCHNITSLSIGAGVTSIDQAAFTCSDHLKAITVSPQNTVFTLENGILMDQARTTVYLAVGDENHTVTIPSTVTHVNAKGLENPELKQILVNESNNTYTSVEGVLYSKDQQELYRIPASYNNILNLPNQAQLPSHMICRVPISGTMDMPSQSTYHTTDITEVFSGNPENLSKIVFGETTDPSVFFSFLHWNRGKEKPVYLDVSKNKAFYVVADAVYNKEMTTLYVYQGNAQEYVMPDSVVELYEYSTVFPNTCKLTSITLGKNFKSHNKKLHIAPLQNIQVATQNAIYSSVDGILYSKDQTTCILCPQNYTKNATIPEGVKEISSHAFTDMTVEAITLPSTLEKIYDNAFYGLHGLKTIEIPLHAQLENYSFNECIDLETILWNSQEYVNGTLFRNCPNLTSLIIGPDANNFSHNNLQVLDGKTLVTSTIGNITLDEKNPNYILKNDFLLDKTGKTLYAYLADYDSTLKLPKGVTTIGQKAFAHAKNLKQVSFPDSLQTIESKAFFKCQTLQTLTFPKKVSKIGEKSFYRCNGLKKVTFKGNQLKSCAKDAFQKNGRSFTVYSHSSSLSKLKKVLKKCKISDKRYINRFKTFS